MNEQGTFTAALLDHSGRAFASGTIIRLQEESEEGARLVEQLGFQALVDDVHERIQLLAEALAVGAPELVQRDARWAATMHNSRGVSAKLLPEVMTQLRAELLENLPEGDGVRAANYIELAMKCTSDSQEPESNLGADNPHRELLGQFLLAVLEGRGRDAETLMTSALDDGSSVHDLHHMVLTPAQRELGSMWHRGEISVAEEHLGSRITEQSLAAIRARMTQAPSAQKKVLLASVSGNLHDIGLRVVADRFELEGWTSVFLGANMPIADLAQAVRDYAPDLIALSAGLGTHLRATANSIELLRMEHDTVPIIVGGGPFSEIDGLWKSVGADACAPTAEAAVRIGIELTRN
jgi:MerR family transcriptional regulator, light-induced transcriptional regulator